MAYLKFKAWLVEKEIKQKDVADLLGISVENLNKKVNGKQKFTLAQVKKICEKYNISADLFFI
jgi:DNA-binding Xre family transcriptional regulator